MTNINVFDHRINFIVNVLRSDEKITVRTFGLASPEIAQSLSSDYKLRGSAVTDYLWGLGQPQALPQEPDLWMPQMSRFRPQPWFESDHVANLDPGSLVIQHDSLTIERSSDILGRNGGDATVWCFSANNEGRLQVQNLTLATLIGRESPRLALARLRTIPIFMLFQKYRSTKWSEADTILFNSDFYSQAWHNLGEIKDRIALSLYLENTAAYHPKYDLQAVRYVNTINPGVLVRAFDECGKLDESVNTTLYLEAISGYLPHTQVEMTKGRAMFRMMPLGLSNGEKMRVKGGWRNMPGLFDLEMEVDGQAS